ncbi:HD family phosphohydrolase [Cytobacillus sp. IB215665]|uniref:HD family phosphohydrolase n=1 Tax=Cytobacillus sp. IB215665 TaxID=3097357 RepID=UPI002A16A991|nr:HD family phosphohydrolase [Cytobacillus sp. IB215665]MDX8364190.1 HD family phosphohydrolase [Cytobacillus sp. IB215665]
MKLIEYMKKLLTLLKEYKFVHIGFYVVIAAVIFLALYSNVEPKKYNIQLHSDAEQTIYSPKTIEDKEMTERKRKEAAGEVQDVFLQKKEYEENSVDVISDFFSWIDEVNGELNEKYANIRAVIENEEGIENEEVELEPQRLEPTDEEKIELLKTKMPEDIVNLFSDQEIEVLFQATPEQLTNAQEKAITVVQNIMSEELRTNEIESAKRQAENELQYLNVKSSLRNTISKLVKFVIIPNMIYDVEATEEKREQARNAVEPVMIIQGQIIVEEGELITQDIIRKLEVIDLVQNKRSFQPFIGLGLMIGLMLAAVAYHFFRDESKRSNKNVDLLLYTIIFTITILLMKGTSLLHQFGWSDIGYLTPIAVGPLLIKVLINDRLAVLTSTIFAVCGSIMFNEGVIGSFNFSIGVYFLCSGLVGVFFLDRINRRAKILQSGLFISVINIIVITSIMLLKNGQYSLLEIGIYVAMAIFSGLSAAVLTIGIMPFLEAGFGILSTIKLIELSNPNHPLLRKILVETPGTYHHSVMVANLSEAACEAIGANGLLARVGSYYHDIGKTKRPQFFIENQMNIENPHNNIAPQLSKNIIIAHATEGAEMLRKHKLPTEIVDIAAQHHGTSLIKYFYHKAQQQSEIPISEEEFRYPGPKPQTKEAAIIGIADSVEAAVRSLTNPSSAEIQKLIKNIIADRLQDGQLNSCDLTLKELDVVSSSLCETLKGIFHSRIEYPEATRQKVKEA